MDGDLEKLEHRRSEYCELSYLPQKIPLSELENPTQDLILCPGWYK